MAATAHVSATSECKIGHSRHGTWEVAEPTEWLVKTGMGVKDIEVGRKFYRWPGQKISAVNMKPRNISFNLHSISKDMVPFDIPVTFTITPHDPTNDKVGFLRYAQRMNGLTEAEYHTILTGIIHGQTRILAGTLEVMDIFNGRDQFKLHVQEKVEKELIPYGLSVTNANISELRDMPGDDNRYFESLKQKAISGATNNARVEVAENRKRGDVGTKQRKAQATKDMSYIEAENQKAQNEQRAAIAQSNRDLEMIRIECEREINLKREEANNAPKARAAQLQTALNKLEGTKAVEYLRATNFAKASVEAESAAKGAEGRAAAQRADADADKYTREQTAEADAVAQRKLADATKYSREQKALADAIAQRAAAEVNKYTREQTAEADATAQRALAEADKYTRKQTAEADAAAQCAMAEADKYTRQQTAEAEAAAQCAMAEASKFSREQKAEADAAAQRASAEADKYTRQQMAEAEAAAQCAMAEASKFSREQKAEADAAAQRALAEADKYTRQQTAEADAAAQCAMAEASKFSREQKALADAAAQRASAEADKYTREQAAEADAAAQCASADAGKYSREQKAQAEAAAQRALAEADKYTREQTAEAEQFARQKIGDADKYTRQQAADVDMYAREQRATAELFVKQKEAEGIVTTQEAQAQATLIMQEAQAKGIVAMKEAEAQGILATQSAQAKGIQAKLEAQAEGLSKFLTAADPELTKFYLALEKGLFTDMAAKTAAALHGMSPKINIWTTGAAGGGEPGGAGDAMAPLRNLFTTLPPMLDAVASQTGVRMPGWMPSQDPNWEKAVADSKDLYANGGPAPAAAGAVVATKK